VGPATRALLDQLDDLVERRLRALLGDDAPQLDLISSVAEDPHPFLIGLQR